MELRVEVTNLTKKDILIILREAIINHVWEFDVELEEIPKLLLENKEPLKVRKVSRNIYFQLSLHNFIKGVEIHINNGGSRNIYNYNLQDSDAVIQYALFGTIVY